ncbi:MAG: WD40 repeat domain-containing protein, partial [Methylophilaceae bacterium]|nr:WD40 repeat domain-containing protein [Methylophilaceae bacterium]
MKKQTEITRVWGLLLGALLCLPADGACETAPCNLGVREIIVEHVVPTECASTSALDSCCATIAQDFRDTWTVLQRIESKADELCSSCDATPITGPYTINNSGIYCLQADSTGPITITAQNVTLDLNNHTISGGTDGVVINGDNAWVKNGTVRDTIANGITITAAGCTLDTLDVLGSPTGFLLQNASTTKITNCRALENTFAGFSLIAGTTNNLTNCQAINQAGTSSIYGFVANSGQGNIFQECQAIGAQTVATGADYIAGGFVLGDAEFFDTIINCKASTIQANGTAQAYGILADTVTGPQDIFIANNAALTSIDWSPDGLFFAYAAATIVKVFSFDGTDLTFTYSINLAGSIISKIAWQPANTSPYRIAVASGNNTLSTYNFNGTTLTPANMTSTQGITTLAWSSDGDYIAVNFSAPGSNALIV